MFQILGIILVSVIGLLVLVIAALLVNHTVKLNAEAKAHPAPGLLVTVDGKKLHVHTAGEGDHTLVFMAGHGTSNPTLDFKPLWSELTDEYKTVVVEKSGYGWSETSNSPRDIDTLLEETRAALDEVGVSAPYVLVPHSMSGLEAIRWAQKYPGEVTTIIGLDPAVPAAYDLLEIPPKMQLNMVYFISRLGLSRFMPEEDFNKTMPLMTSDVLTEEEKEEYRAIFYRSSFTRDMLNEAKQVNANAETVAEEEKPSGIPMFFFISEEQDETLDGWKVALTDYLTGIDTSDHRVLETGHYVHHEKADTIVTEIKAFLGGLD